MVMEIVVFCLFITKENEHYIDYTPNDTILGVFRVNFDTELVESSENTNEYKLRMLRENHHGNQKAGRELYSVLAIWHYSSMGSLSGPTEKLQISQILMPVEKTSTILQHYIWGSHILMSHFAIGYLRKDNKRPFLSDRLHHSSWLMISIT